MSVKEKDSSAVQAATAIIAAGAVPDIHWIHGDDQCDCTFQQIGEWANPYIAQTLRVRICCFWALWFKEHPELVQEIPAYYDANRHTYATEPIEWDSDEMDMPYPLWYRALARKLGQPLDWVREHYKDRKDERPKKIKERKVSMPTPKELTRALNARLKAAGWID